jgi:hypothetical protein
MKMNDRYESRTKNTLRTVATPELRAVHGGISGDDDVRLEMAPTTEMPEMGDMAGRKQN